ncbi:MAG: hypothetical protein DRJ09_09595 [Bacteroidetes bacterium]|nr:MAG: hypothetical protein DRJ09_09595 [Bacteroidota bacterium]
MKKFLLFSVSLFILTSVFNISLATASSKGGKKIELSNFNKKAADFVGKTIRLQGIVDHVCEHDGKKMFLVDESSDARVKIVPNENMAAFTQDLIGETVEVTGIVKEFRLDEDYLIEMEEKVKSESNEESEIHMGDGEHKDKKEEHNTKDKMKQINNLRQKLKDSGNDHLSFYSVEATSFKIIK